MVFTPGWIGIGDTPNQVIVRFAQDLPEGQYHATIVGQGSDGVTNLYYGPDGKPVAPLANTAGVPFGYGLDPAHPTDGSNLVWTFSLELAPQVVAVVPQPVSETGGVVTQSRNTIDVYFTPGDQMQSLTGTTDPSTGVFTGTLDPSFFQLINTQGTETPDDDAWINPTTVAYTFDQTTGVNEAVLAFNDVTIHYANGSPDTPLTINDDSIGLAAFAAGSLRLQVGSQSQAITTTSLGVLDTPSSDDSSTYGTADNLGSVLGGGAPQSVVLGGSIDPQSNPYAIQFPAGTDAPGSRDLPAGLGEDIESGFESAPQTDPTGPIDTYTYTFSTTYLGDDGRSYPSDITEAQKESVRGIFELFENYFGVQF